jgi:hypothetical protein
MGRLTEALDAFRHAEQIQCPRGDFFEQDVQCFTRLVGSGSATLY